jgi:hypothetical protein
LDAASLGVELTLDGRETTVLALGHQIDAVILFTVAVRPVPPQPHVAILRGLNSVLLQVPANKLFEVVALHPLGIRKLTVRIKKHIERRCQESNPREEKQVKSA